MGEFDLIARYFTRAPHRLEASPALGLPRPSFLATGIGDDCAVLTPAPGMQLCVSSDMLVEGRHFFSDVDPEALGHKALAVNLSDLAACGATPRAFTLALALPRVNEAWLASFSRGLFALADLHGCTLVGGDTTQGPLNICITVLGEVPVGQAILRSGAQAGDDMYVSGNALEHVGQARFALEILRGTITTTNAIAHGQARVALRHRLERPSPRVLLGKALRGIASAAIDLSDGLLGDLGHVLKASHLGASLQTLWIKGFEGNEPVALAWRGLQEIDQLRFALSGGDDYELLFTAAPSQRAAVAHAAAASGVCVTRIGVMEQELGLRVLSAHGVPLPPHLQAAFSSFDHFKT